MWKGNSVTEADLLGSVWLHNVALLAQIFPSVQVATLDIYVAT